MGKITRVKFLQGAEMGCTFHTRYEKNYFDSDIIQLVFETLKSFSIQQKRTKKRGRITKRLRTVQDCYPIIQKGENMICKIKYQL